MDLKAITDALIEDLKALRFGPPVTHVYNPLEYAREPYDRYLSRYACRPKEVVLVGMNPGPWGMAQTGVPFGDVNLVRGWLKVEAPVGLPPARHPQRPVLGFSCPRGEMSGKRLWGWAQKQFGTPERFFTRFFVANYCPLLFIDADGRNRTPDALPLSQRKSLLAACDRALRLTVEWFTPRYVVGVGQFAEDRARAALNGLQVTVGGITHPSPANPRANRGWEALVEEKLSSLGIRI
jgi:single-strand selective monofunctional uracil DNA glycosylase